MRPDRRRLLVGLALLLVVLCGAASTLAQPAAATVFIDRGATTALVFVDLASGQQNRVEVDGERFTIVGDSVMLFDSRNRTVELIGADGRTREHPFITLTPEETRVDWAISGDGKRIAWTTIRGAVPDSITTVTRVADIDGAHARTVYQETRSDGLRARPVAFSPDDARLYLDYQPDGLDALMIFPQYAGLFSIDLTAQDPQETFAFLPGEPGDFTGAGFGGGYFLRLAVSEQAGGFDVLVRQSADDFPIDIPATRGGGYSIAGDVLVSPDGRYAVYAQAALQGVGVGAAQAETVLMLVNLSDLSQSALTAPLEGVMRPVAFSEEDAAVILVSTTRPGTWKARLSDGRVQQVAQLSYLGQLTAR